MNARITLVIITCAFFFLEEALSQGLNYPLHIGDAWQYERTPGSGSSYSYISGDTIMQNGKPYKVYTHTWERLFTYQRIIGDTVYFFHADRNQEYVLFNFSAHNNALLSSIPGEDDTTDIYFFNSADSIEVFGQSQRKWKFLIDYYRHVYDDELLLEVVPNYGIVQYWNLFINFNLRGAIIDNQTYGTITGVGEPVYSLPSQFTLGQNYPNPFNPTTNILYRIERSGFVTLKIYDPVGREVKSLVTGIQQPGEYSVSWNATGIPSGVYYYILTNGTSSLTKTAILLK